MTMTAAAVQPVRRVAIYARVSSDDQRERATIQTQVEVLDRGVALTPGIEVVARYLDDGVSGMVPLGKRPEGARLIRDGANARFSELLVYDVDRLGRDAPDVMRARRDLGELGIRIFTPSGEVPPLLLDLQAVISDYARVQFLKRSADGMARAARQGRYTGGIVSFGYRIEGRKEAARYVPDTAPLSPALDLSAADVVRLIYRRLAFDHRTCPQIANELNALDVPTSYALAGREVQKRGQRKQRTQGLWRSGRVRNMAIEPKYKGSLAYGRRSKRPREVVVADVEPLVSEELWQAAQDALHDNGRIARNTSRVYLLKGVLRCATCELVFVGSQGRENVTWYRCGGKTAHRGPLDGHCPSAFVRGADLEEEIWRVVERFLRDPGDILTELEADANVRSGADDADVELATLRRALDGLDGQRQRVLDLTIRGRIVGRAVDDQLDRISGERSVIEARLHALDARERAEAPGRGLDLLDELRRRLDGGLTDAQRQAIVQLLVTVRVHTDVVPGARATARAAITFKFPKHSFGVLQTSTDMREGFDYTVLRRVVELPTGRRRRAA